MTKELTESEAWKEIVSLFGDDAVFHPQEILKVDAIKTGSPELDRALCVGGLPRGRFVQLAGQPSAGKSFVSLLVMKEWQTLDPKNCCCFIDAECTFDNEWALSLGLDLDRILLIKTNLADKIFTGLIGTTRKNKVTGKITKNPGLLNMIADGNTIKHKVNGREIVLDLSKMGVIVLDSVANMQTPLESESEVGKRNYSPLANFLSAELKKLTLPIAKANVAFIAINQVRENLDKFGFGNVEKTPGGKALHHCCSMQVEFAPMLSAENVLLDEMNEKIGHKIRAKISKNKLGPPNKKAEFFVNFKTGIVRQEEELLSLGTLYGLIERPNIRSYILDGKKLTSRELALEYIKEHQSDLEEKIRAAYLSGQKPVAKVEPEDEENPFDASETDEEAEEIVEIG